MGSDPPVLTFLEYTDTVFWVVSPLNHLSYVSPAFERIWRRPVDEVTGPIETFIGTVHPDDREAMIAWIEQGAQALDPRSTEYRIVRPDGGVRWIRTRAFPAGFGEGGAPRFAGMSDDITEERTRSLALEQASRRLQRTFESLQEAVFIVDTPSRVIVECNPAALAMFGYTRDEILGAPTRLLHVSDDTAREFDEIGLPILLREGVYQGEFRMRSKDGRVFETDHTVSLLNPEAGQADGVVSVIRDLSGRRELERRLLRAQRLEAVGQLAGGVAHDFNNLLTIVQGNLGLLAETDGLPAGAHDLLGEIAEAARRGAEVTRELLAFGRRQVLDPSPVDLGLVLRNMEGLLRRLFGEDVVVEIRIGEGPAVLDVDRSRLEQAILNLAVNARQAMRGGGKFVLAVRAEPALSQADLVRFPEAGAGPHVILEVADTGVGMSGDTRSRIFEPFFTTRAHEGGTGLGLPSVYGMVTQSGGSVAVESEPGHGTTFFLTFPASGGHPGEGRESSHAMEAGGGGVTGEGAAGEGGTGAGATGAGAAGAGSTVATILVVEDDLGVRGALVRVLERAGFDVRTAGSVEEARARFDGGELDDVRVCLSDVVLPGASGIDLAVHLEATRPAVQVLLMSGYSNERLQMATRERTAAEYLTKPFTQEEVIRKVRALLSSRTNLP